MRNTVALLVLLLLHTSGITQKKNPPKLIVGIVVDQMCYDYLYRFAPKFSKSGFLKLMNNGTNCRNTNYNYVPTYTGPGHASIYTGTTPSNHGIIANEWFDRSTGKLINCVDDSLVQPIGTISDDGKCSPTSLKSYTITDQLKMTYPKSKVVSMSIKDRGAILPGGHLSDGSYWYDYATGRFITSSFFKESLPPWVSDFNNRNNADLWMKNTWNTLYPVESYIESGPDDSPYEHLIAGKTSPTFPYDFKQLPSPAALYSVFTATPFANTMLTDFAIESLSAEALGTDTYADMLCISYSTPDIVGHSFGPYSVEIEDIYLRLDLEISRFIKALEQEVGKNNFVLFLTADHAVVPVPQMLVDKKMPGGYLYVDEVMVELGRSIQSKFGENFINTLENNNIYLDHERMRAMNVDPAGIEHYIASEIIKWRGVKHVYTAHDMKNGCSDNEWRDMVRKGYDAAKSGDVLFILEPGYLVKEVKGELSGRGTSHGSAFNYDTHVPLLWSGKGVKRMEIFRNIEIVDIAATLTHLLNLQRSGAMTGHPITEILGQ